MRRKKLLGLIISALIIGITVSSPFQLAFSYPDAMILSSGEAFHVDTGYPVVSVHSREGESSGTSWLRLPTKLTMSAAKPGNYIVEFRLFGLIPLRRISLTVREPVMVVPGGHSIGVVLRSEGLVITGLAPVTTLDGRIVWPSRNTGLEAGDVILSAADKKVHIKEDLALAVDQAGREGKWVQLTVEKPDGSLVQKVLYPVRDRDGGFKLGLLVKDSLAGVGTLTFYQPDTRLYAALGHMISEGDSQRPSAMKKGHIVQATVTGVSPSRKGEPGEILGVFVEGQDVLGRILKNGPCGIVGILDQDLGNPYHLAPIPLAFQSQVRKGPAYLLTTVNGRQIKKYAMEIEDVFMGSGMSSRGFTIRITDPELLRVTGGIVQGMSGSPIIQDGRLVGAVTHVLVNDPTRGYGTFAEWMAEEAKMVPSATYSGHENGKAAFCEDSERRMSPN